LPLWRGIANPAQALQRLKGRHLGFAPDEAHRRGGVPFLEKWGWLAGGPAKMAATNKCLAQSNKSPHRTNATKKRKGPCCVDARHDRQSSRQPRTTTMTRLLICTATILALTASANAQSVVPLSDRGRFHGYVGAKPHWCTWSAAKVCTAWRARGGKFICPPGNMSMSCRLQRGV
jgi:hypothetical protein